MSPFVSRKQEKYLWSQHPEIAKKWEKEHGSFKSGTKNAIKRKLKKSK